jgi:cytochrome c553
VKFAVVVRLSLPLLAALVLFGCSDGEPNGTETSLTEEQALLQQGSQKARMCTGCHGPAGISRIPSIPSIAGKPAGYLANQLHAFKTGEREDPTMSSIARNLSEADIQALSAFYASRPGAEEADR